MDTVFVYEVSKQQIKIIVSNNKIRTREPTFPLVRWPRRAGLSVNCCNLWIQYYLINTLNDIEDRHKCVCLCSGNNVFMKDSIRGMDPWIHWIRKLKPERWMYWRSQARMELIKPCSRESQAVPPFPITHPPLLGTTEGPMTSWSPTNGHWV